MGCFTVSHFFIGLSLLQDVFLKTFAAAATETASRMLADALHLFSGDLRRVPTWFLILFGGKPMDNTKLQ